MRKKTAAFILSFISQDIVGADAAQFDHAFFETQSQAVSLADADLEFVCPTQFLQPQGRMAEILKQQVQPLVDAFPDFWGQSPVIFEKSVCSSNDHCADLS